MVLGSGNFFAPSVGSFQVPVTPPDVDPDEGQLMTVCFNPAWLPFVLGALQQLTLQATWAGDDTVVLLAQSRAQTLLAMFGSPDGGCSDVVCFSGMRYDSGSDQVQQTFDGGTTWANAPYADPRHATSFLFPSVGGTDPQCQAAARMTRYIHDMIDEVILVVDTAGEAEGLLALLLALLVELGPFGILIDLVLGLAAVLFGAGSLALAAAFTSTVYDQLTCIFFCDIENDGTVTAADLESILSNVNTEIGGLVYSVLSAMFFLMGEVGLSNAGTIGDPLTPDCSGCGCAWCWDFDATSNLADWVGENYSGALATWDGTQWNSGDNGDTAVIWISYTFTSAVMISDLAITEYTPTGFNAAIFANGDGTTFSGTHVWQNTGVVPGALPLSVTRLDAYILIAHDRTAHTLQQIQISGTGTPPFGGSNC